MSRQAIKSDGTDGTAALKAYLLEHGDEVLSQELYEFSLSPRVVLQYADHFVDYGGVSDFGSTAVLPQKTIGGNILFAFLDRGYGTLASVPTITDTAGNAYGAPIYSALTGDGRCVFAWAITAVEFAPGNAVTWDDGGSHGNSEFYVLEVSAVYAGFAYGYAQGTGAVASATVGSNTFKTPTAGPASQWTIFLAALAPAAGSSYSGINLVFLSSLGPPTPPGTLASAAHSEVIAATPLPGLFTDASSPLSYAGKVYLPANIKNDGFKSKIGLDVDSLKLSWNFRGDEAMVVDPNTSATILTMLQGFRYGLWAGVWVKWRRIYMPTFGDCETLAAVSMFRGRIGPVTVDRLTAQITVNSITEAFNRKVPAQLIEANNRSGQIGPGLPPDLNNDPAHWTVFQCVAGAGGTMQKIVAQQTAPMAGAVYAPGTFDLGYLLFEATPLASFVAQVQHYEVIAGYNVFYLFKPLYVDPHAYALKFVAFVPVPKDQTVSGATGVELKPFPYVPLPEQAV